MDDEEQIENSIVDRNSKHLNQAEGYHSPYNLLYYW